MAIWHNMINGVIVNCSRKDWGVGDIVTYFNVGQLCQYFPQWYEADCHERGSNSSSL